MKFFELTIYLFTALLVAQTSKIGIGVEYNSKATTSDSNEDGPNVAFVYFPIIVNGFMVEPQLSYYRVKNDTDYDDSNYLDPEVINTDIFLAVGLYKTNTFKNTRAYLGIKWGKVWEKYENSIEEDEEDTFTFFAPTIGGEYFLGDNFSFGIEAYYLMASYTTEIESVAKIESSYHSLQPKMMFRVYF